MTLNIDDDIVLSKIKLTVESIPNNDAMMVELHNTLIIYCDPYVPMRDGMLSKNVVATKDYAHYLSPYAHYMHEGVVFGPNIPIIENGVIVGWWSPPVKQPTGESINYSTQLHPQATHHWEQAMLRDKKEPFIKDLSKIILDTLNRGEQNG